MTGLFGPDSPANQRLIQPDYRAELAQQRQRSCCMVAGKEMMELVLGNPACVLCWIFCESEIQFSLSGLRPYALLVTNHPRQHRALNSL
jgi:hypothetical protein